jgi:hypothetical protein
MGQERPDVTTIVEGHLELEFDDTWVVVKWDDHRAFRAGIGTLCGPISGAGKQRDEGTKAVDILGVREARLYLIELKDFRGHRIESKQRQIDELPLEIGLKVRDSLAGMIGAAIFADEPTSPFVLGLTCLGRLVQPRVVALITEDANPAWNHPGKRAAVAHERLQNLKRRLRWLTTKVSVLSPLDNTLPGLRTRSLAGASH